MVYPLIYAGQRVTAALLTSMLPLESVKLSGTSRASTTTFSDDPDLTLQLEANATYAVEMYVHAAAVAAGDIKTIWTVPVGATGNKAVMGPSTAALDGNADNITMRSGVHGTSTVVTYNGVRDSSAQFYFFERATIVTISAGTLALQWAQSVSSVSSTIVGAGSYIRAKRTA